jgi:hypothetical protein
VVNQCGNETKVNSGKTSDGGAVNTDADQKQEARKEGRPESGKRKAERGEVWRQAR